jgi:hypothetical protein
MQDRTGRDGRAIVRRGAFRSANGAIDVADLALVTVSSEQALYPIDNVFDGQSGPGGSCWVAALPGAQIVNLRFRAPLRLEHVVVETEEHGGIRTQQIDVAVWTGEEVRLEPPPQSFRFAPYGPSFHRATFDIATAAVSRIEIRITPQPAHRIVSLTTIAFH